jgi:NDP-sugar pyrophosphorylase family protein
MGRNLENSEPGLRAAYESQAHVLKIHHPNEVTLENIQKRIAQITQNSAAPRQPPTIEILVPMAGEGSRFQQAGFLKPKPFISVLGKPMIEWVVKNLQPKRFPFVFTFLVNEHHFKANEPEILLRRLAPNCRVLSVPSTTQGAACTALLAADALQLQRPLLIANSDQWVDFSIDDFIEESLQTNCDGNILTFKACEEKWSYAKADSLGFVEEVAEKKPISDQATVGIYFFRKAKQFVEAAQQMIRKEIRTRNEFYLCPVYNELIQNLGRVRISEIPSRAMHGLGTPEDLDAFLRFHLRYAPSCDRLPAFEPQLDPN